MNSVSITTRLTVTFAVLTAVVLIPAAVAIYVSVARAYTSESVEKANHRVRAVADSVLGQLDGDLLSEFEGNAVNFEGFRHGVEHWAVVRGRQLEFATGVFADPLFEESWSEAANQSSFEGTNTLLDTTASDATLPNRVPGRVPDTIETAHGPLRVASIPLHRFTGLKLEELPVAAREALHGDALRGKINDPQYLTGKREAREGVNIIEVSALTRILHEGVLRDVIAEIKISESGEVLKAKGEPIPKEIDPSFLSHIPEAVRPVGALRHHWKAWNGQIIAVIDGTTANGNSTRVAMNPLGELFELDENGEVVGPDPQSRVMVLAAVDVSSEISRKQALRLGMLLGAPALWLVLTIIGWFVTRRAMSPIEGIVEATKHVHLSDLGGRVPVSNADDELTRIATTINDMLDRLEKGYRRERRFTGDASHELRGPLTKIQADVDVALSRNRTVEEYRDALGRVGDYAKGMQRLVESLLLLARLDGDQEKLHKEPFDLTQLIFETVGTLPDGESRRIRLDLGENQGPVEAIGQRSLIGTAIHNLLENALRYSPAEQPVNIHVRQDDAYAVVEVADHGTGVSPDDRDRVFDRFYRVDVARARETGGTGLGLSIVRAIALAHGTRVELRSSEDGGTRARFEMRLAG